MANTLEKLGLLMSGVASARSQDPTYLRSTLTMQDAFQQMKDREQAERQAKEQDALLMRLMSPQIGTPATKAFQVNGRTVGQNAPAQMTNVAPDAKLRMLSQMPGFRDEALKQLLAKQFPQKNKPMVVGATDRVVDGDTYKTLVEAAPTEPKQIDVERRAVLAGYQPGTPQFMEFIRQATLRPNSVTNVNMPDAKGDVKYMEEIGKLVAEDFSNLQRAGTAAQTSLGKFDRLGGLLETLDTGAFKGTTTQLKSAAKSAGMDLESMGITDDVAPAQAAAAITNEIALQLRNPAGGAGMPGAMSDKDREFLVQMVPGLETTPGGNKLLVDYWKRLNKRNIEVAKMARDYMKKNNGRFDYGFYDELADYSEKNSLFPEAETTAPTAPPAVPSGWSIKRVGP